MKLSLQERTIRDFGEQWTAYRENHGYYASSALFADIVAPLLEVQDIRGCRVAEIGSGTGRIANMLLELGAEHLVALEPSAAFDVLRKNLAPRAEQVTLLRVTGEQLPPTGDLDYVFSIGVLHHIPEPRPVVAAAYRALRPGGKLGVWLYGKEGNRLYLSVAQPLRAVARRLPHALLQGLVRALDLPLLAYMQLCRALPLPLRGYLNGVLRHFGPAERRLVIYDQLNPAYAKYYTQAEARALLEQAGFQDVRVHHRHGYSWTVVGERGL